MKTNKTTEKPNKLKCGKPLPNEHYQCYFTFDVLEILSWKAWLIDLYKMNKMSFSESMTTPNIT